MPFSLVGLCLLLAGICALVQQFAQARWVFILVAGLLLLVGVG